MPSSRPRSSGVEIGECRGVVRVPRRVFQRLWASPHARAARRGELPTTAPVREHRRAEAAPATVGRGREYGDQRAELTLTGKMPGERAEGNEAQVLGVIDISGLSAHCKLNYRSQSE
jgi:hypothetical protein